MSDLYPPTVQRPALLKLVEALGCRDVALCRDECGDWQIRGKHGHIYAVPGIPWGDMRGVEGFQLYCAKPTARTWGFAKKTLDEFCTVTLDGDTEGTFFLQHLPTKDEAVIIRGVLGIKKRRDLTEGSLASLVRARALSPLQGARPAKDPP